MPLPVVLIQGPVAATASRGVQTEVARLVAEGELLQGSWVQAGLEEVRPESTIVQSSEEKTKPMKTELDWSCLESTCAEENT